MSVQDDVLLDELKAILYQYKKLCDRWSEDRQDFAKQGYNIEQLVNVFTEKVTQFSKLEPIVKQKIVASIQEAAKEGVKQVHDATRAEMNEAVSFTIERFQSTVHEARKLLNGYEKKSRKDELISYGKVIIVGIVSALFIVKLMMPSPIYPIDDERLHYIWSGEKLNQIWPKLSKAEQQKITRLFDAQSKKDHELY